MNKNRIIIYSVEFSKQRLLSLYVFDHKQMLTHWDEQQENWYFSIVDVIKH